MIGVISGVGAEKNLDIVVSERQSLETDQSCAIRDRRVSTHAIDIDEEHTGIGDE